MTALTRMAATTARGSSAPTSSPEVATRQAQAAKKKKTLFFVYLKNKKVAADIPLLTSSRAQNVSSLSVAFVLFCFS